MEETKHMRYAAALLCVVVLAGCAATGPVYQDAPEPRETDALVYIFRPNPFLSIAGGRDAYFYVNDVNIVDLSAEGYTWFHIPAGEYSLKQKWPYDISYGGHVIEKKVNWQPRQKYFYRLDSTGSVTTTQFTLQWQLSEVNADQALAGIGHCKLQPAFGMPKLLEKIGKN